jgi:hypothetical protein
VAANDIARSGAAIGESSTKEGHKTKLPAQTPPNPGPPGGAVPGDLAQAMVAQSRETKAAARAADVISATVAQSLATTEIAANTKTVQAFDAMLEELSRGKAQNAD